MDILLFPFPDVPGMAPAVAPRIERILTLRLPPGWESVEGCFSGAHSLVSSSDFVIGIGSYSTLVMHASAITKLANEFAGHELDWDSCGSPIVDVIKHKMWLRPSFSGQRVAFLRSYRIVIRDYDPAAVRRSLSSGKRSGTRVPYDGFENEVSCSLPYVEYESPKEVEYTSVHLYQDKLVGLRVSAFLTFLVNTEG